jgi:hypothetical protein
MRNFRWAIRIGMFVISVVALWIAIALVLWRAYSFDALIRDGAYSRQSAVTWVSEFAAILSIVVGLVWAFSIVRNETLDLSILRIVWRIFWHTCLGTLVYAAIILARRETWSQGRGEDDWAMFFGEANARFFSEAGPLAFFLEVLPAASVVSALLFAGQSACERRFARIANKTPAPGE